MENTTLRQMRLDKDLSLYEVAEKVGVTASCISRWETGKTKNFKRNRLLPYATALGCQVTDILDAMGEHTTTESEDRVLLSYYARLTPDGRMKLVEYAKDILGNPIYREESSETAKQLRNSVPGKKETEETLDSEDNG